MRLKSVVLPAPFGPINPVILPLDAESEQLFTASTPPNDFVSLSTSKIGDCPGIGSLAIV
jgi:hypothetical protein